MKRTCGSDQYPTTDLLKLNERCDILLMKYYFPLSLCIHQMFITSTGNVCTFFTCSCSCSGTQYKYSLYYFFSTDLPVLCPDMALEGTLWFGNFLLPDSYMILAVATMVMNLINLEVTSDINMFHGVCQWYSRSALDCWSIGQAIDPAPGA